MRKKSVLKLTTVVLTLGLLAGCGSSSGNNKTDNGTETQEASDSNNDNSEDAGSDAKLTVWMYAWETGATELMQEDAIAYYEETGVEIEIIPISSDSYDAKIQATLAGGENPDIAVVDAGNLSIVLADKGVLLELDDFGVEEYKDRFYEAVWNDMVWEEKVHGLRITSNNLGLYYNKEMFDEAGLDYPTEAWTWEDLRAAAQTLTDEDAGVFGFDLPIYEDNGGYSFAWLPFLWQNGGQLLSDDRTEAAFATPEAAEALEFWKTLAQEDKSIPLSKAPTGINRFSSEQTAMTVDGPWSLSTYVSDPDFKDKFGVAPLPQQEERATVIGGEGFSIFANTAYPQEAYDYLIHLTCSDFTEQLWTEWITIPPQQDYVSFYSDNTELGEYIQVFSEQMEVAQNRQFTPTWSQVSNALAFGLEDYMYDVTDDALSALESTAEEVNAILSEE